ncbi:hypothetical protein [Pseudonocardia zijingensis]|jgi:hypothetical protein
MLNQLHTAADIAADHRRTLLAEADAHRLARVARPARHARRAWLPFLRLRRAQRVQTCGSAPA